MFLYVYLFLFYYIVLERISVYARFAKVNMWLVRVTYKTINVVIFNLKKYGMEFLQFKYFSYFSVKALFK